MAADIRPDARTTTRVSQDSITDSGRPVRARVSDVGANEIAHGAPKVDSSEIRHEAEGGGYSGGATDVTPEYGGEAESQPIAQSVASGMSQQADDQANARKELDDRTKSDMLRIASMFGTLPKSADGSLRAPTRDEGANAFQVMQENTPLPNESSRPSDSYRPDRRFSSNDLKMATAAEDMALIESGTSRQEINRQNTEREERARQERYESAASEARDLRQQLESRSIESSNRVKPSIFQRLVNFVPRRKQQFATDLTPSHRPHQNIDSIKEAAKNRFSPRGVGFHIYGKMVALPTLDLRDIGVGIQELAAVIEQDSSMLDKLLRSSLPESELENFNSTQIMRVGEVADLINRNYVEVFTCKPPDNRGQDMQRRRLKVLEAEQRGIYLHPSMAAMYTADYDGDDMKVSLDPAMRNQAKDPMEQMVGVDGEQSLDTSFLHVAFIRDGWDEGKSARDYVREIILHDFSNKKMNKVERNAFNKIVDTVVELSRTTFMGSDEQAVAWGDFFRAARDFSDARAITAAERNDGKPSARYSNRTMSDIVSAVCNGFRNITAQTTLLTIGEVVPRDTLPPAYTSGDSALYDLIDGLVMGAVPNNFQELKVMMNGFLGNVAGKSAPFRFTADVGKMMKLDTRFMISSNEFEYDPDNEEAMTDLLQKTVKYAYSARMAVEIKANGKQMNLMETVRRNVIRDVGFLDDLVTKKDANGNDVTVARYANVTQFLEAFIDSYNRNAAIANEANLVWLANMGIKVDKNRKAINTINNSRSRGENRFSDVRFVDVATPFIDIYGNYSLNRMFGKYQHHDAELDENGNVKKPAYDFEIPNGFVERKFWSKSNTSVRGNEDWGVSDDGRWIRGVYGPMSIRAFSVSNRIVLTRENEKEIHSNTLYQTNNAMDSFIAAIADKRTSTSSSYNTKVPGRYSGDNFSRGHVETRTKQGEKTVVGTTCDILKDIKNANVEGTLLMPGFYAGIGPHDAPQEVQDMATEIAKELAKKQFCLRSGHAEGMDVAFENGAGGNANIYMPYKGFNSNQKKGGIPVNGRAIVFEDQSETDRDAAKESVLRYHSKGERLLRNYEEGEANKPQPGASDEEWREYGRKTIGYKIVRSDYFQIFGTEPERAEDGKVIESAFVVCYDANRQTTRIAQDRNIPIFDAADYENLEDWKNDVLEAADKCLQGQLYRTTTFDQMLHVDDAVMAINATGYELFHDLNMDSTAGFLMSTYGRAMVHYADNADIIAGIRAAMVFKQQTQQIGRYFDQLASLDIDQPGSLSREQYIKEQIYFAIDELSDKSLVWKGILQELRADGNPNNSSYQTAFETLRRERSKNRSKKLKGMEYWNADDFWTNREYDGMYKNVRDVIEDLHMPWPMKCDIITDVVRWQLNDPRIQPFEIMYQMEVGSNSLSTYSMNSSSKATMQVWKDTNSASFRYANHSLRNVRREVKEASDMYRSETGALTKTIHNLATNPHLLVHVEDSTYADAILSVRDKLYPQTEKAKKHPWTNYIYGALSFQRNGGYFNDVYRYDNRLLGLQHVSDIKPADILRLLDDPDYYLCVYDDYGSLNFLDQQGLLGLNHAPSEREIWDWLNANPRIAASILRQGVACCHTDTEGGAYIGSRHSVSETIGNLKDAKYDALGNVKYLMRDHPVFAGIVSLLNPAHGTTTRNERNRVPKVENRLCYEIYSAAKNGYGAHTIMRNLGITRQKLLSLLTSDYDKYMAHLGFGFDKDSIGEARNEASDIYETIMRHLQNYIDEVEKNVNLDQTMSLAGYDGVINSFHDSNDKPTFLSNMFTTPVVYNGVKYRSAESAFQAQKCADPADRERFTHYLGKKARAEGRKVKLREDWDAVKDDIMREIIHAKFSNPKMRALLDQTGTAYLEEGNTWGDQYWGTVNGVGENKLGQILMDERGSVNEENLDKLGMDIESLASFWDTIQEFSGAKVGVSTGIEGGETYRLSYWVSHMGAKDGYADLKAIEELIRKSENYQDFDGAWTNKGKFVVRWTENGVVTNLKQLQSFCDNEAEEIVIKVPEGFDVPDRSTDSFGKQVPSLYVSMVSKRSNGAEKFNLKAMKAGLDGTDSVTKMKGKYLTETFKDSQGNDKDYPVFFFDIRNRLQNIMNKDGIDVARMTLAQMIMEQDRNMGYKDLTLANYMSIASVMLLELEQPDAQGNTIVLRSLEQLVTALKNRIGCKVDTMTNEEVMERVQEIMNDTSDQGVGVSATSSQYELLSNLRPFSASSDSTTPMRVQSSVFSRNYDLLKQIQKENNDFTMLTATEKQEIHDSIVGENGVSDIADIWNRSDILRNYSVIGYYGSNAKGRESNLSHVNIGPSNAIVIGSSNIDSKKVFGICNACYKRGVTVVVSFDSVKSIPDVYLKDAIPISDRGDMMIPMFDARLNGSEARPFQPRFSIFRAEFDRYVISAEDPYNVFNLGDAQYKFTSALVKKLKAHDNGSKAMTAIQMFPNVFNNPEYRNCTFEVGMADRNVIEDLVLSEGPAGPSPRCTIDYGLVEGANGFDQRVHDVNKAISRYAEMLGNSNDDDGVLRGVELKPGDIVGWAQINISKQGQTTKSVLAPLIPFPLTGANKVPESFTVVQAGKENNDGSLMSVDWSYTKELVDGFIKYFDSSGGANKGMISLTDIIEDSMRLKNGMEMGAYCAAASTDSRKIGTDRRVKTMISLMAMARMTGYNFARTDDAFPDDPDIKEKLSNERLPIDFWKQYYAGYDVKPLKFCNDDQLSAFLNHECKKIFDNGGNPSDYLATTFTGELDDTSANEHIMWEFECMFENSLSYEDMLLRYLNRMMKGFCPNGIDDASEDNMFRLYQTNGDLGTGFDKGMLQMQVPYPTADGRISYIWSNVYVGMSFFGEDWSGNSRPNVRGSSDSLDAENTNSYYHMQLSSEKFLQRGIWSTADQGRPPADSGQYAAVLPYLFNWK